MGGVSLFKHLFWEGKSSRTMEPVSHSFLPMSTQLASASSIGDPPFYGPHVLTSPFDMKERGAMGYGGIFGPVGAWGEWPLGFLKEGSWELGLWYSIRPNLSICKVELIVEETPQVLGEIDQYSSSDNFFPSPTFYNFSLPEHSVVTLRLSVAGNNPLRPSYLEPDIRFNFVAADRLSA